MRTVAVFILLFVSCALALPTLRAVQYQGSVQLDPTFSLSWSIWSTNTPTTTLIELTATVNYSSWVAFGLHLPNATTTGMGNADFIVGVFDSNGKANVTDCWSNPVNGGYAIPVLDTELGGTNNILASSGFQTSTPIPLSSWTVLRDMNTGDLKTDHPVVPGQMQIVWAHGNPAASNPNILAYHGPMNRGSGLVNFFTTSQSSQTISTN
eukprot:TRINITY_DN14632_c0_g1_i2.p1 TRINITY_DN14632_c0_g1~~TRINITY_DN14632_c0_g1_i2.p1  ORF type:complete len:209 (-),score=37.70 TRINITY_DN14632_c0_g1_i2:106-732(-)